MAALRCARDGGERGLAVLFVRRYQRSLFVRHASGVRNEGKGAPFLHSFHKAFPGSPPKVHVRGEGVYVYDQVRVQICRQLVSVYDSAPYGRLAALQLVLRTGKGSPLSPTSVSNIL